jgi:hypothetical protein
VPPAPQTASPQPYLPEMGYSSPSTVYQPPTRSTVTASAPSRSYPVAVPAQTLDVADVAPRASFEHPPGTFTLSLPLIFTSCFLTSLYCSVLTEARLSTKPVRRQPNGRAKSRFPATSRAKQPMASRGDLERQPRRGQHLGDG